MRLGDGIAPPEGDQVYELWLAAGAAAPERVEIFRPDDDGSVAVLMDGMTPRCPIGVTAVPP